MSRDGKPTRQLVLGIETATSHGSVAVAEGAQLLGELHLYHPRSHSERLLPAVETLLASAGLKPQNLKGIAVSSGPGSFTGLRIGLAAAKGLAFALGLPLYGVPTLEALAANVSSRPGLICAFLDARRGELFSARFRFRGGDLTKVREEHLTLPSDLLADLPGNALLIGHAPPALSKLLNRKGFAAPAAAPRHLSFPRASTAALVGSSRLAAGVYSDPAQVEPLYIRPSDAEENRRGKS